MNNPKPRVGNDIGFSQRRNDGETKGSSGENTFLFFYKNKIRIESCSPTICRGTVGYV